MREKKQQISRIKNPQFDTIEIENTRYFFQNKYPSIVDTKLFFYIGIVVNTS